MMNKTRNLLVASAIALAAGVFSACGGSSNGGSNAGSDIPTDGILGELPALNVQWLAEQEQMRQDIENESNDDKRTELNKKFSEWQKTREEKAKQVLDVLDGKEIPTEVAEGVPFRLDSNLKMFKPSSISGYRSAIGLGAKTTGTLTEDLANDYDVVNYTYVPYDADGKVIELFKRILITNPSAKGKTGDNYEFTASGIHATEDWVRLAKIVIMDKRSEAYKQIEAQAKGE